PGWRAVVSQVDGRRWLSLEGPATVTSDPDRCRDAERRYAQRYRQPKQRDDRVVIEISVDRVLGRG
ncbi:MAG: PPOX class F420-dependent enzyme, partial [Acidimicrobiales bacterium]